jgi:outer membrane protein
MRKTLFATATLSTLLALDANALDLLQAYQRALANDPVYAGARHALRAGEESIAQGRAGLLPTLGATGSNGRQDTERDGVETATNARTNNYTIELKQPLLRWANWEQYQRGKLSAAFSEAEFAQAGQDLIVRVAQAYFDVLNAQDTLASVQAQKLAITEQLASAKRNFEVGTATITDTHEAQARFDLVVAQEFAASNDLEVRRAALDQIIGVPAGEIAGLRRGVQLSAPQPAQIDPWISSAEMQNYSVVGSQLAYEIARRDISATRAEHLPTVDVVARRSHNRGGTITNPTTESDSRFVGVEWNIPLFSGFAVTSRVRQAIALEDKARADLETARRNASQNARQSFLGVNSGLAQVRALEAAELSSQSALDSNKLGYEVGVRINIDVLNAQQQLYLTRRDLAKARYDTLLNSLKLKSAAGTLKEDDLAQLNGLLAYTQPTANMQGPAAQQTAKAKTAR